MFRHLAILKFNPEASEEVRTRFVDNFPNMARSIPQIKSWSIGRDYVAPIISERVVVQFHI